MGLDFIFYLIRRFKRIMLVGTALYLVNTCFTLYSEAMENREFKQNGRLVFVDTVNDMKRVGSQFEVRFKTTSGQAVKSSLFASAYLEQRVKEAYSIDIIYLPETPTKIRAAGEAHPISTYIWDVVWQVVILLILIAIPAPRKQKQHA